MQPLNSRTLIHAALVALISLGAVSTPALAGPADKPAANAEAKDSSPMGLQIEARRIATELNKIEKKTIASNKSLQAKRKQFAEHVTQAMEKTGYNPKDDTKQLVALRDSIMGGKLSKDERAKKIQEFQTIRARLATHERKALQSKALREESRKLGQAMMMAMKKQDPKTDKLLQRLSEINQKLQAMRQAAAAKPQH